MGATIPSQMSVITYDGAGGPEVIRTAKRDVPEPSVGEVLVRVAAAGVNRPDVLQRMGGYAPPPGASDIPGLEVAGEVVAIGPDADRWKVGDKVMALVTGGGYAEYCAVPQVQALAVPERLSMTEAAGVPETFFTVWTNVFQRGRLQPGERFLVHGGASGIGTTAIQLAEAKGARVFATAGDAARCRACEELGAERAINYHDEDFVEILKDATDRQGIDVILDMVGGDYIARNMKVLATEGRIVFIAFLGGSKREIDFMPLMLKRGTITGSTLRAQSVEAKGQIADELTREVLPLLETGRVKPIIHATYPLAEAVEAHRAIDQAHVGKIILTMD